MGRARGSRRLKLISLVNEQVVAHRLERAAWQQLLHRGAPFGGDRPRWAISRARIDEQSTGGALSMQPNDEGLGEAALSELSDAVRRLSDDVADLPGKIDDLASVLSGVGSLSPNSDVVILPTLLPATAQRMNVTVDQGVADQLRAIDHPAAARLSGNTRWVSTPGNKASGTWPSCLPKRRSGRWCCRSRRSRYSARSLRTAPRRQSRIVPPWTSSPPPSEKSRPRAGVPERREANEGLPRRGEDPHRLLDPRGVFKPAEHSAF